MTYTENIKAFINQVRVNQSDTVIQNYLPIIGEQQQIKYMKIEHNEQQQITNNQQDSIKEDNKTQNIQQINDIKQVDIQKTDTQDDKPNENPFDDDDDWKELETQKKKKITFSIKNKNNIQQQPQAPIQIQEPVQKPESQINKNSDEVQNNQLTSSTYIKTKIMSEQPQLSKDILELFDIINQDQNQNQDQKQQESQEPQQPVESNKSQDKDIKLSDFYQTENQDNQQQETKQEEQNQVQQEYQDQQDQFQEQTWQEW